MKSRVLLKLVILCILFTPILSQGGWTEKDTEYQLTFTLLNVADWAQTREILKSSKYDESNIILGDNPTVTEVDVYFAVTTLGHYFIAKNLNDEYRRYWQSVWIVIEAGYVSHNYRAGVRIEF